MRKLWLWIILGGLALPMNSTAKDFWFDYQKVFETGPDAELTLTYVSGNLSIVGSDDDRIIVEARKRVSAVNMDEAALVADHIEIKAKHDKGRVDITTNYLRMRQRSASFWSKILGTGGDDSYGEVDWTIAVPTGCRVKIIATDGKMVIGHVIGDLDIKTSAAEIELSSIEGRIDIESSSGQTIGDLLFGPVTIRQAQGRIALKYVEGDIRIRSTSATISVSQDRGALDLTTSTGDVEIQTNLDSSRDFLVETETGSIKLSIPETSSGELRIQSQTGDIQTDIPIAIKSMSQKQVEGTFGFGGVQITLTSVSGDVTVAQF